MSNFKNTYNSRLQNTFLLVFLLFGLAFFSKSEPAETSTDNHISIGISEVLSSPTNNSNYQHQVKEEVHLHSPKDVDRNTFFPLFFDKEGQSETEDDRTLDYFSKRSHPFSDVVQKQRGINLTLNSPLFKALSLRILTGIILLH
jgi:hypothetical protein